MAVNNERLPVLIVGAGPVGLTMALALSICGIKFRIVDKAPHRSDKSKALGIHARTLELLETLGVIDMFLKNGHIVHATNLFCGSQKIVHFSLDEIPSPYPFALMVPQSETERLLAEELSERGIDIEREMEVTNFIQDDDKVTTTIRHAGGTEETIQSNWLIGCDGAHSTIRHTLGLSFDGETYEEGFATIDCYVDWENSDDELHGYLCEEGIVFFFPMGNRRYRIVANCAPHKAEDLLTLEKMQELVNHRCAKNVPLSNPQWVTYFTINRRSVKQYNVGRAFVCGDAAHVHSPVMGQGMNTGMQDALNLAWKIELVEKGIAARELLESYNNERHPVGQNLLNSTDAMTKLVTLRSPVSQEVRNHLIPLLANQDVLHERACRKISMVGLNYRASSIVGEYRESISQVFRHPVAEVPAWLEFGHGPLPGDRAPDGEVHTANSVAPSTLFEQIRGFAHFVLLFSGLHKDSLHGIKLENAIQQVKECYSEFIRPLIIVSGDTLPSGANEQQTLLDKDGSLHHKYGAFHNCLYLIRPDGYVGFRSQPIDLEQLQKHLHNAYSFTPGTVPLQL